MFLHTHGPGLTIIHGRVNQRGSDTVFGCGGVVLRAHGKDVRGLGSCDADLERLVVRVVEGLDKGIKLVVETCHGALEDEVDRGLVAGLAEGAVPAIVGGNLVEVPQNALESGAGCQLGFG